MLGAAIATRPLARDGLGLLSSDLGRTRLAETPLPAWGRAGASIMEREHGASAAPVRATVTTRP